MCDVPMTVWSAMPSSRVLATVTLPSFGPGSSSEDARGLNGLSPAMTPNG